MIIALQQEETTKIQPTEESKCVDYTCTRLHLTGYGTFQWVLQTVCLCEINLIRLVQDTHSGGFTTIPNGGSTKVSFGFFVSRTLNKKNQQGMESEQEETENTPV
jgi:hypothetical protein